MTSPTPIKTRTIVSLPPELLENVLSSTLDNFAQAADRQRFRLCSLAFVCKAFYNIAKSIDKHLLILPSAKAAQTYLESGREGDREGVTALHIALELDWGNKRSEPIFATGHLEDCAAVLPALQHLEVYLQSTGHGIGLWPAAKLAFLSQSLERLGDRLVSLALHLPSQGSYCTWNIGGWLVFMRRLRHLSMPGFRPTINLFEGFGYDPRQADEDDQYRNFGGLETLVVEEVHIRLIELAARSGRLHLSILGGPLPLPGASPHERWSGIENLTVSAIYLTGQEANLPIFHNVTHLTCLHDHGIESVEAARTFFDTFPVLRVLTLPGEGSARDYTAGTKEWDTVPVLPLSLRRLIVTRTTKWTDEDRLRLREACEARQLDLVSL